jgi:hypothetical protein
MPNLFPFYDYYGFRKNPPRMLIKTSNAAHPAGSYYDGTTFWRWHDPEYANRFYADKGVRDYNVYDIKHNDQSRQVALYDCVAWIEGRIEDDPEPMDTQQRKNPDVDLQLLIRQISVEPYNETLWERLAISAKRMGRIIAISDEYLRSERGALYVVDAARHFDSKALALKVFEHTLEGASFAWYLPIAEITDYLKAGPIEVAAVDPRHI